MKGNYHAYNPEKTLKHPVNPFSEIIMSDVAPGKANEGKRVFFQDTESSQQGHNLRQSDHNQQQYFNPHSGLARTYSLRMEHDPAFIELNNSTVVDSPTRFDKPILPLKFLGGDTNGKGFAKINSAREMNAPRVYNFKGELNLDDHGSQKGVMSGLDKDKLKSALQWSPKRRKPKNSDELSSIKKSTIVDSGFQIVPIQNGRPINIVQTESPGQPKGRRSTNHLSSKANGNPLIPSPTSESHPSPNSQNGKVIRRDFSYTALNIKSSRNPGSYFSNLQHKTKYFQVPTQPDTPSYQNIQFRIPKKDDFWIGHSLGKGRFGDVNLVKHKQIGFVCAMKTISKETIQQEKFVNQFCREVTIQMYLQHCHITSMYGVFDDENNVYLLLEACLDGQLFKFMKKNRPMPEQEAVSMVRQICKGVEYLHDEGIIHRDLKPENIIMHQGLLKICDFGWAVYNKDNLRQTFCGTPMFLSPEMLRGDNYCQKIDNWAIGMITYEMVVGRPAFKIKSQKDLQKILNEQIQFPEQYKTSACAQNFILGLLERDQQNRLDIESALDHSFLSGS